MQITLEFINGQKEALEQQRQQALTALNQIAGAVAMLDNLAKRMAEPEPDQGDGEVVSLPERSKQKDKA